MSDNFTYSYSSLLRTSHSLRSLSLSIQISISPLRKEKIQKIIPTDKGSVKSLFTSYKCGVKIELSVDPNLFISNLP